MSYKQNYDPHLLRTHVSVVNVDRNFIRNIRILTHANLIPYRYYYYFCSKHFNQQ